MAPGSKPPTMKVIVLLIDDDPTSILIHRMLLQREFPDVIIKEFTSAPLALDFLKSVQNPDCFHFSILLDIFMPEMSGWEFLEILQEHQNWSYSIHLITSSIDPREKTRSETYKCVHSFTEKPLLRSHLHELRLRPYVSSWDAAALRDEGFSN